MEHDIIKTQIKTRMNSLEMPNSKRKSKIATMLPEREERISATLLT